MDEKQKIERIPAQEEHIRSHGFDLMALVYRLLEKWKIIALSALICMVAMAFYSFVIAKPVYEATSKLYVLNASDSAINLSDLQIGTYLTSDYLQVFEAWEVHEIVMQNLNLDCQYKDMKKMLTVSNPSNTRILHISVRNHSPELAAALANEYADVAKKYISETMRTDEPNILSEAPVPTAPVAPRKKLNMMLGFLVGLLAASSFLVVQFLLDDKIKTADDIRKYADMPTLAVVPTNKTSYRQSNRHRW